MRVVIVHYHLRRGGVTRIVQHAVKSLQAKGAQTLVLSGEAADAEVGGYRVIPGLRYEEQRPQISGTQLLEQMRREAMDALGAPPDLWHIHNHSLGKNLLVPQVVRQLALDGEALLLQIHDFAEDGRPALYRRMLEQMADGDAQRLSGLLYPSGSRVHYAVLNGRDAGFLAHAGAEPGCLHPLANPVDLELPATAAPPDGERLMLYPTRAIRRKNLGEFLLLAATAAPGERYATTLAPENPGERPFYERWTALAAQWDLPMDFELGLHNEFEDLLARAHTLVSTSVGEGFGMAFLEPWLAARPVWGRDLPEITWEFRDAGMRFGPLYERLDLPLDWLGRDRLAEAAMAGLRRSWSAYGREPEENDRELALEAWIQDQRVDFGRLDEPLQERVLERIVASAHAASELNRPVIPDLDPEQIALNADTVRSEFSLQAYGQRLGEIYQGLLDTPGGPIDNLNASLLLDSFLDPTRLQLLRT